MIWPLSVNSFWEELVNFQIKKPLHCIINTFMKARPLKIICECLYFFVMTSSTLLMMAYHEFYAMYIKLH